MWPDASRAVVTGHDGPRVGNRGFSGSPGASTFRCADGWISTAANTARQFRALCETIGLAHVADDATLMDTAAMAAGKGFVTAVDPARLQAMLAEAIGRQGAADMEARLAAQDVPCARLVTLAEFLKRAFAGGMLTLPQRRTVYPHGVLTDFGAGYKADGAEGAALAPAPRLGQDTRVLLVATGMAENTINALASEGFIRV
jgi:crotonobetainyl-CoA:carnitine CoA-transferase CaiB-like acyl-CoA transferase